MPGSESDRALVLHLIRIWEQAALNRRWPGISNVRRRQHSVTRSLAQAVVRLLDAPLLALRLARPRQTGLLGTFRLPPWHKP